MTGRTSEESSRALTERELSILDFEREWWAHAGERDTAVRREFGVSALDYRRELNALIDRPEAAAAHPRVVARLRRSRSRRVTERRRGA